MNDTTQNPSSLLPIPNQPLKALLERLNVSVKQGALNNAIKSVDEELTGSPLLTRLGAIFQKLKLRGVQPMELNWHRFDQRRLPALLWLDNQWLVAEREDGKILLSDENGQRIDLEEEMLQSAKVLWLKTPDMGKSSAEGASKGKRASAMVWQELFRTKGWLRDVVIATLMINLLAVATSIFAMQVYDRVVPTLAYATLWTLVSGMGIVILIDWFLKQARNRILDSLSCNVDRNLSQRVFEHVMHLRLDTRPQSLGTLAAQVGGLDSVRQFFSSGVIFALVDMPFALVFIIFISFIGGPIAWVYVALLPVALLIGLFAQARLRSLAKERMIRSNERQGLLVDVIRGSESIRASGASWRFSDQWKDITRSISGYNITQKDISNRTINVVGSLSSLAYVAAIVVGVGQIESGNLSMGALIGCSILGGRVIGPIARSVQIISQWQGVSQALTMVDGLLDLSTEREPEQSLLVPEKAPDAIALRDVSFSFPESPVLQLNIPQLDFKAGDRVLLVGAIGSGKSTLLKVLAGLYRPTEGSVKLGNAELWEIDPAVVSDQVGYLPQNVHLFKGTLRSNLALSGAVSDSELLRVCETLGIDRIASASPRNMDLPISEGGEGLSGGQKQIVGLGRVFLGQPKVWLLDEPTASLDYESDEQVLNAINSKVKPDDILIISTHRTGIASRMANRIIALEQGKVVEDGSPDIVMAKLMSRRGQGTNKTMNSSSKPVVTNGGRNRVI
ncbi:ATP-binding cassette domain-containing protein [Vibrio sp. WJH972]